MRDLTDEWLADDGPFIAITGPHRTNATMVYALTAHTIELARGVLALRDAGCHVQAVPLVRQAIECAITARWLVMYKDAVRSLLHEGARQRRDALNALAGTGFASFPDQVAEAKSILDLLDAERTGAGRSFQQRCEEIEGGAGIYATYRAASAYSHAGVAVAELYVSSVPVTDEYPGGFALNDGPDFGGADAWLGTMLSMVVTAALAWDEIERHHRHRKYLRGVATRLGIVTEPRMTNAGYVSHQRAERRLRQERRAAFRARS